MPRDRNAGSLNYNILNICQEMHLAVNHGTCVRWHAEIMVKGDDEAAWIAKLDRTRARPIGPGPLEGGCGLDTYDAESLFSTYGFQTKLNRSHTIY